MLPITERYLKRARILVVDDQPMNVELLTQLLEREGYSEIRSVMDSEKVMATYEEFMPDLILLDLHLPKISGLTLLLQMRAAQTADAYLPILVLTADITREAKTQALTNGATDFLAKPLDILEVALRIRNLLEARFLYLQLHSQNQNLGEQVEVQTVSLRAGERKYRSLVEHLPIITYIVEFNENHPITYISPQVEGVLGYTIQEWISDPGFWDKRLHPEDRVRVNTAIRTADAAGEAANLEFRMMAKDGRAVWLHGWSVPVADETGVFRYAHGILEDITERKQAEAQLLQSEERFSKIFEASPAGITLANLSDGRIIDANPALLKMTGYTRDALLGHLVQELGFDMDPAIFPQIEDALKTQRTIQGVEFSFQTAEGRLVETMSSLEVIELEGQPYLLGMHQDITELKKRGLELEAIAAVSAALLKAKTRADMEPLILDELMTLLRVEAASLAFLQPNNIVFTELGRGAWSTLTGVRIPADESVSGIVLKSGQPYHNDTIANDSRFAAQARVAQVQAVACAPLRAGQQPFGVLWIGREKSIAKDEVNMLVAIADIAANALHRAALHEQTEQRLRRLNVLRSVDQAITGSFDVKLVLGVILDQLTTQLGVQAAAFLLLDVPTRTLQYAAGKGFRTRIIEESRLRLGEGIAGKAALEGRTVQVSNLAVLGSQFKRTSLLTKEGFTAYRAIPAIAKGQVKGVLEIYRDTEFDQDAEWEEYTEALASQAAIAIDNAELFGNLQRSNMDLALAYDATLEGWSHALDLRDKETEGHSKRVTDMTVQLAQAMDLGPETLVNIRRGALLHDIGKLGIPDGILLKPGKLTDEEWVIMKKHPTYAYEMLSPIYYLQDSLDIPYCHHEKWDGTGYPRGLKGEAIPLAARLFAVVDVWDALRSDRPYREGWSVDKVRAYIKDEAGKHFDPQVAEVFLNQVAR